MDNIVWRTAYEYAYYWRKQLHDAWRHRHESPWYRQRVRYCLRQYKMWCQHI